ncbi:MAG: transcriptional regulator, MerR family protein, partial [Clostridia bacterium]|nr:transcriptional regulator, MerR family protein [Clostridia bacterium]
MEYTVQKLANLAGISTRTLRYYDEIGILKPARINSSGYRIYGQKEVDRLQQILFFRELGVDLDSIKNIVTAPTFDGAAALKEHREKLLEKRAQLDALIENVNKTIAVTEGRIKMTNKEKFQGFKKNMIEENEKKYGKEIREKYGKD